MKVTALLLACSLGINAALVGVIVAGESNSSPETPRAPGAAAVTTVEKLNSVSKPIAEAWSGLRTDDLSVLRDRLSAEGFPPSIIRAILAAQISEGFAARRKVLEGTLANQPFWKSTIFDPKTSAEMRALNREQTKALKDLLGPDPDNGSAANLRRQFPNLSADKISQLAAMRDNYDEQRQDLYATFRGQITPDQGEKLRALDKAMHGEYASVLTPEELEDVDLRTGNAANNLRYNLAAFDATEPEFRSLYKLQSAFDEQYAFSIGAPPSQDQMRARNQAQQQLSDDIRAALGPDRYADYQRANDYNFRQTAQLVARLELPPESANQVYAMQQDLQQRVNTINQDRTLTPDDRIAQRAALNDEAQTKITAVLGARGYEAYKQYGGQWMQVLHPPQRMQPRN